jgi:deazaflavin-dependent oxidoreductase (nitroreductase family)
MADRIAGADRVPAQPGRAPWYVPLFNPLTRFLLRIGVPLGFNGLITIRGRKTGLPRTTPVAIIDVGGRRWIWSPWGEVHWVRNLRAAGSATINLRGRAEEVRATEMDPTQRVGFFRDVMGPLARGIPFGYWFIRLVDGVDLDHPAAAAVRCPVFELEPVRESPSAASTGG